MSRDIFVSFQALDRRAADYPAFLAGANRIDRKGVWLPLERYRQLRGMTLRALPEGRGTVGLGDVVHAAISIVTLGQGEHFAAAVAKWAGVEDCGCARRREALNAAVPDVRRPFKT